MLNKLSFLNKTITWVYVSVIYLCLMAIGKFLASLLPILLIVQIANNDNSISWEEFKDAFFLYSQEISSQSPLNIEAVAYALSLNILLPLPFIIIGVFVLMKRSWARYLWISLVAFLLIQPIIFAVINKGFTLKLITHYVLVYFIILIFFFQKQTIELYETKNT